MDEPIKQAKLSKKEGRDLPKIVHLGLWRSHLKTIGLDPDAELVLSWKNEGGRRQKAEGKRNLASNFSLTSFRHRGD